MKVLVKFYWDCGRMGHLDGLFITTKEEIDSIIGKNIYFGEVLGKHSDIEGEMENGDLAIVSEDQDFISKCEQIFGSNRLCGYNPFSYIEEDEEEDEERFAE